MKNYLEIKSLGNIDVHAFILIGASTKRDDESKIGFYGSGNKHSVASLLKQGIDFKVFSGEDEITFTTRKQMFRDQEFEVILVNGQETSLTITLGGGDWLNTFAPIREIYSNALDEDTDATLNKVTEMIPEAGYTKFFIEMTTDVEHFYNNLHLYFCNNNPKVLFSNIYGSIFTNTDSGNIRVFRKGILTHLDEKEKAVFHYNFQELDINESRVVKYVWQINDRISKIFKACTDENLVSSLILQLHGSNSGYLEHKANWEDYNKFSDAWYNVCIKKRFAPIEFLDMFDPAELENTYKLPMKLLKALKSQFEDIYVLGINSKSDVAFVEVKPSQILIDKVIDATSRLYNSDYKHRLEDPLISYVKFSDANTLGLADNNIIYLSTKLDVNSVDEIAKIIIEENEHNITGYGDETRVFQNHLFNLYYDQLIR